MADDAPVAVITGGAVGIGQAIAIAVARRGGSVFNVDIDAQGNAETDRMVNEAGGRCQSYAEDAGSAAAMRTVFDEIQKKTDRLDLLVNNAAIWNDTALKAGNYAEQAQAFEIALNSGVSSAYNCALAAVPLLEKSDNPNIVNIITEHVKEGHYITGLAATGYDVAKFGLWRLTESWAMELKDSGIRVNGLCFGATDTPMLRAVSEPMAEAGMKPEDIADAVFNVVDQGPDGDTGQSYLFGTNGTPREQSLKEIALLKTPQTA